MHTNLKPATEFSENRKRVRYQIDYDPIEIFDLETARVLGQVKNITVDGCLLKSDWPVTLDREYRIRMLLPGQIAERSVIHCSMTSLWSRVSKDTAAKANQAFSQVYTGCKFLDISEDEAETIDALIAMLGKDPNR